METRTYVNARMLVIRPRDLKCEKKKFKLEKLHVWDWLTYSERTSPLAKMKLLVPIGRMI